MASRLDKLIKQKEAVDKALKEIKRRKNISKQTKGKKRTRKAKNKGKKRKGKKVTTTQVAQPPIRLDNKKGDKLEVNIVAKERRKKKSKSFAQRRAEEIAKTGIADPSQLRQQQKIASDILGYQTQTRDPLALRNRRGRYNQAGGVGAFASTPGGRYDTLQPGQGIRTGQQEQVITAPRYVARQPVYGADIPDPRVGGRPRLPRRGAGRSDTGYTDDEDDDPGPPRGGGRRGRRFSAARSGTSQTTTLTLPSDFEDTIESVSSAGLSEVETAPDTPPPGISRAKFRMGDFGGERPAKPRATGGNFRSTRAGESDFQRPGIFIPKPKISNFTGERNILDAPEIPEDDESFGTESELGGVMGEGFNVLPEEVFQRLQLQANPDRRLVVSELPNQFLSIDTPGDRREQAIERQGLIEPPREFDALSRSSGTSFRTAIPLEEFSGGGQTAIEDLVKRDDSDDDIGIDIQELRKEETGFRPFKELPPPPPAHSRRRGRPKGSKNKPKSSPPVKVAPEPQPEPEPEPEPIPPPIPQGGSYNVAEVKQRQKVLLRLLKQYFGEFKAGEVDDFTSPQQLRDLVGGESEVINELIEYWENRVRLGKASRD